MSKILIEKLSAERSDLATQIDRMAAEAAERGVDLSEAELGNLSLIQERVGTIDSQLRPLVEFEQQKAAAADVQTLMAREEARRQDVVAERRDGSAEMSLGQAFVRSAEFAEWNGHGSSGRFTLDTRAVLETGAPIGSHFLPPAAQQYVVGQPSFQPTLLDVVGRLPVTNGSLDLMVWGSPKGATGFAVVPEKDQKPEATLVASKQTVTLETIAAYVEVTRQLLEDAPALRSFIDQQLRLGYRWKLEEEAATAIAAGTFTPTTGASGQPLLEVVRQGMATLQTQGFRANAVLVNPADAAAFDLAVFQNTLGGAAYGAPVWGLQVVPVVGLAEPLLGDFSVGVQHLVRAESQVFITDSHAGRFLENIFTVLCEGRAKTVVTQPQAITRLEVTP